ncbi:DUF3795 domain-containing protein [Candidatus Bipolaricaulota bacterium]|nr:DUF3795 domain-containing protein [Candidatus Bipolaricaulota bacterium]
MSDRNLEAFCGLYCGACYTYVARQRGTLADHAASRGRPLEDAKCNGCRSGVLSSSCRDCTLRDCAQERGLTSCGDCFDMPCDELLRITKLLPHLVEIVGNLERLREVGSAEWLDEQAAHWACPACKTPGSWYEVKCTACGHDLPAGYTR